MTIQMTLTAIINICFGNIKSYNNNDGWRASSRNLIEFVMMK